MPVLTVFIAGLHVIFAIAWLGSALFFAVVLGPMFKELSLQTRNEFMVKFLPKVERFEMLVSTLTIAFGIILAFLISAFNPFIITGMSFGIFAYLIGLLLMTPLAREMMNLMSVRRDENTLKELIRVNRRFGQASMIELVFMLLAFATMVTSAFI
ncbi:MAG: hypothetical protein JRM98_03410 [Nitrososphaerota archaeon]|jgi:uncharacterized protein YacL|nr:hypothetical protein [Nitrososphaerota archaeon]